MQKPDWFKRKGQDYEARKTKKRKKKEQKKKKKERKKRREKTKPREETKGGGKRERDNAKKKSILCLRMEKCTWLPPESLSVSLLLLLSEWRTADWWHPAAVKRRSSSRLIWGGCFGKDRSGGEGPSLEYPGRPEMPWPSSGEGCGCPWCSSSYGALAASTPASTRRPPGGTF